ncbi:hypothetical protein IGS61_05330 [Janthinobacterium sp. FW305-129]|uniref:hypothetical protein n=1 Tax=Janthinobacterium sp. FW305-129 TaxID=2775054 RepID=UPI001E352EAD|nr:hypothetical protein [Janthinobacterium sp. FW305-129]MCC7596898.1 hypothetical protein [Janthinobacterium sp. FW305-129]
MSQFPDTTAAWTALVGDMQGQRLLRLHFPHGDGPAGIQFLANSLAASESLSRDFSYVVEVLSDDAAIALDKVMGKMVTIYRTFTHKSPAQILSQKKIKGEKLWKKSENLMTKSLENILDTQQLLTLTLKKNKKILRILKY